MSGDAVIDEDGFTDIGDSHSYKFTAYEGDPHAGLVYKHLKSDGTLCEGFISIKGGKWAEAFRGNPNHQSWDMVFSNPLTLFPSLECRVCGDHGFISNGKWVKA